MSSSLFQPLSLLGLVKHLNKRGVKIINMATNVIIIACVMVMRSLLKKNGLWKRSIEHHIVYNVRSVVHDDRQVIHKKKDEESPASPHRSAASLGGTNEEERMHSIVHSMFQRKKLWDVGGTIDA